MEMLTPEEFFKRVGVRVPESVIRNLEQQRSSREWWLGRYLPLTDELLDDMCIEGQREAPEVQRIEGPHLDCDDFDQALEQLGLELKRTSHRGPSYQEQEPPG